MLFNMEYNSLFFQIELIASYLTLHRREDNWTLSLTKDLKILYPFSEPLLSGIEFLIPWISSDAVLGAGDTSLDWKYSISSNSAIWYAGGSTSLRGVLFSDIKQISIFKRHYLPTWGNFSEVGCEFGVPQLVSLARETCIAQSVRVKGPCWRWLEFF